MIPLHKIPNEVNGYNHLLTRTQRECIIEFLRYYGTAGSDEYRHYIGIQLNRNGRYEKLLTINHRDFVSNRIARVNYIEFGETNIPYWSSDYAANNSPETEINWSFVTIFNHEGVAINV